MWFKHKAWIPVAYGLAIINVGATYFAAMPAEAAHATVHAALAAAFILGAKKLEERRRALQPEDELAQALDENTELQQTISTMEDQVRQLEERVDFAERMLIQNREKTSSD